MAGVPPNTLRQTELSEFPLRGPFGGIQSDLPIDLIEQYGFSSIQNLLLINGIARPFGGFVPVLSTSSQFCGMAEFFNGLGQKLVLTIQPGLARVNWYSAFPTGAATALTGTLSSALTPFSFSVVGGKLCFCQGIDKVKYWDGVATTFQDTSASAVPARYLFELGNHLLALYTIDGGVANPQRVHYTGAGDPTDWTSFNSGQVDLFNDMGPIAGGFKLGQGGFIVQAGGITQVQLTGLGLQPFAFYPMFRRGRGSPYPYTISVYGDLAGYADTNDIFLFDGTQAIPIGGQPVDGKRRIGARSAIMADLQKVAPTVPFAVMIAAAQGFSFRAYCLFIGQAVWVYNIEESNWTHLVFGSTNNLPSYIFTGFLTSSTKSIRIEDLVGPIFAQSWSPATLESSPTIEDIQLADTNGNVAPFPVLNMKTKADAWSLTVPLVFQDNRHTKTIKKIRLEYTVYPDITPSSPSGVPVIVTAQNEQHQFVSQTATLSLGSNGQPLAAGSNVVKIFEISISGRLIQLTLASNYPLSNTVGGSVDILEFTPIYDVGGEVRGG